MDKEQILTKIQDCGIVAVVRAESTDKAIRITDACIEGGVAAIELTFTVPHADEVIEELAKRYTPDEIILGSAFSQRGAHAGRISADRHRGRRNLGEHGRGVGEARPGCIVRGHRGR